MVLSRLDIIALLYKLFKSAFRLHTFEALIRLLKCLSYLYVLPCKKNMKLARLEDINLGFCLAVNKLITDKTQNILFDK